MSWTNELYCVYELAQGVLPVAHSSTKAQIEIAIDDQGEFVDARRVAGEDSDTIIPVTEDSDSRTGKDPAPMPLDDYLVYIAKHYWKYLPGKEQDNKKYNKYIANLEEWAKNPYSHPAVKAIYRYLSNNDVIGDLISCNVLKTGILLSKI